MAQSGQKTVTTAGTQVRLVAASQVVNGPVAIKALSSNTGQMYVGGSDVSSTIGFELDAEEVIIFDFVGDLYEIWIDSAVNGEGVSWLVLIV